MTEDDAIERIADHVLRDTNDTNVVIGPLVEREDQPHPYFTIATSEAKRGFRCDQISINSPELRALVVLALMQRRPLVIHDTDDELYMARLCEALWPGERITTLRKQIERERSH
jgi:hypothetical protein